MARRSADHVVVDSKDEGAFRCLQCGDRYLPTLPAPLRLYSAMMTAWLQMHRGCRPPKTTPATAGTTGGTET